MGIIIRPKSMAYKDPQTGQYTEIDVVGGYTPIVSTETKYQVSNSGTTVPTGTWLENIPTVPQGNFLWMRTALRWNNGVVSYLYSATRQGRDGLGSVSSVNSIGADENGNVNLGDIVHTVNGTAPDSSGNVALGSLVKQVNSISPDSSGNVSLGDIVHKINNVSPDSSGNVALPVDAAPTAGSSNPVSSGGAYDALDGKVNKAGDTMSGTLILTNNSGPRDSGSPQIGFYFDENDWVANIQYTTNKHFCFIERDASDNSIREQFYLPEITSTSGAHYYGILTSKTPVTIEQGGTGATTAAAALTNLGAVNKAGDTITGDLILTKSSNFPSMVFKRHTNPENGPQQLFQSNETGTASYITFYQRINEDSAWEGFGLPHTTQSITGSNVNYGILTTKPGTGSLYYAEGETYSTSTEMMISGYITNGVRNIHLGLWLPKSLEKISSISITSLVGSLRGINGYINGWSGSTNILTQSGITITTARTTPNGVHINIGSSSDLTNATANTPVSLSAKFTISFS